MEEISKDIFCILKFIKNKSEHFKQLLLILTVVGCEFEKESQCDLMVNHH